MPLPKNTGSQIKYRDLKRFLPITLPTVVGVLALVAMFGYGYMRIVSLSEQTQKLAGELASTNALLSEETQLLTKNLSALNQKIVDVSRSAVTTDQRVQSRIGGFEETVGKISGTVGTLEKLSKTDPELLQKYSKVYFLNEHYVPERLVEIESQYLYSDRSVERIHERVWPHLKELFDNAKTAGLALYIKSAYRSFDEQKSLKSAYSVTYGVGTANQFSADQGYSEHQLGTTVDFITTGLGGQLSGFEKTQAYQWMQNSAYQYGFIISYPQNNGSYVFEPWHWRYVGIALATFLHDQGKHFYDLDQREIDEYLVNIFD